MIITPTRQKEHNSQITPKDLMQFVKDWSIQSNFDLEEIYEDDPYDELIGELYDFGVINLSDLNEITPKEFVKVSKKLGYSVGIMGLIRDWMLIRDWRKFQSEVEYYWYVDPNDVSPIETYIGSIEYKQLLSAFQYADAKTKCDSYNFY